MGRDQGVEDGSPTSSLSSSSQPAGPERRIGRRNIVQLLHRAARQLTAQQDPWKDLGMDKIPAERAVRWFYDRPSQSWSCDETIVKIQPDPFTKGAMRSCYRLKKRASFPKEATNTRFHKFDWKTSALNYVAKAYLCPTTGDIDASESAKAQVRNDIVLQHEAQHWATQFNHAGPPTQIVFLRAYALEFVTRPNQPWMAVERYITGRDSYGASFVKHNTNAGFVDRDLRRVTPQVFSAHTFYASNGTRLVADIQGVGDLYTDPQVLSDDYRFGEGDLGPRGMALFFRSFRNCGTSDSLGIPIFPLSKNELKALANKYEDDEVTLSDEEVDEDEETDSLDGKASRADLQRSDGEDGRTGDGDDDHSENRNSVGSRELLDRFQRLDLNRLRRSSALLCVPRLPPRHLAVSAPNDEDMRTQVRSNLSSAKLPSSSPSPSPVRRPQQHLAPRPPRYHRSRSDVDEVTLCLRRAASHREFSMADFHRAPSGELEPRRFKSCHGTSNGNSSSNNNNATITTKSDFHRSALVRKVSSPMVPNDQCRTNLGKVHYQLAVLHGRNRFPEVVVSHHDRDDGTDDNENLPDHDAQSVLFHLSHAASLLNTPACLALARVLSGRTSCLSDLLPSLVPLDFELAKELLERAMMTLTLHPFNDAASSRQSVAPKVAAGCLLIVLLLEERQQKQRELEQEDPPQQQEKNPPPHHNHHFRRVLSETLDLYEQYRNEQQQLDAHRKVLNRSEVASASWASSSSEGFSPSAEPAAAAVPFHIGDRVEANYALEGTFYPAKVARTPENIEEAMDIALDSLRITVQYDDDGSSEDLPVHQVRHWIPPTATQTRSGGPLLPVSGDGAAFGSSVEDDADCELLLRYCEVQALLAEALEHEASADGGARTYRDRNEDDPLVQASALYERAAEEAAQEGMMHKATAWSLKSAELLAL